MNNNSPNGIKLPKDRITNRIWHFAVGVAMILASILLLVDPENGSVLIVFILDLILIVTGIRLLVYYFTMARYMVDSGGILYKAAIFLDFGLFVFNLDNVPQRATMLYLIGIFGATGFIRLLKVFEVKRSGGKFWAVTFIIGVGRVIIAIVSLFFLDSLTVMSALFCVGLLNTAASHFMTAFRRSAVVYVETT